MAYSKGHHLFKYSEEQLAKFKRKKQRLLREIKVAEWNIYKWECAVLAFNDEKDKHRNPLYNKENEYAP